MKKLLSLLLPFGILVASSTAQVVQPVTHMAVSDELVVEDAYNPRHDPEALFDQSLMRALTENLWGTALDLEHMNLDLTEPLNEDDRFAYGQNRIGLPFTIEFATLYTAQRTEGVVGVWSGRLTCINDFYCYGLYYSRGDFATLIPIYSRVDQARLARIMNNVSDLWACNLDSIGDHQLSQNIQMQQRCVDSHEYAVKTLLIGCTATGLVTCWVPFSPPCLLALACDGALIINEFIWQNEFDAEIAMNRACLCNDTVFRANNPTYPVEGTNSPCSSFNCPSPFLPVIFN